jgi:hypothetical protein
MIRPERRSVLLAVACCTVIELSCGGGGDGVTGPPEVRVATHIRATSSTALNGTAGQAVAELPSVIVTDQHDSPMSGVTVTFAVTAGAGSITGESATTSSTGTATIGGWTLGKTAGPNIVTASVAQLTPVTFTASGAPGTPTSIAKTAGDAQTAVAGASVPTAPSVAITDVNGNGVPGVSVTFVMTVGGGTIIGANATTNGSGMATATEWILGKTPGQNSVTATAPNLGSVTFTATGILGPPAALIKFVGDNQTGPGGYPVYLVPGVIVQDANGNPIPGAAITFAPGVGDGSVTGPTSQSDANGKALVGSWALGAVGPNTLVATAGSATATFSATATDPCQYFYALNPETVPIVVPGSLGVHDCRLANGAYEDLIATPPAGIAVIATLSSPSFDTFLSVATDYGLPVAENDDAAAGNHNSSLKVIWKGAASAMHIGVTSSKAGALGDYTLKMSGALEDVQNCEDVFIQRHLTVNENLEATDCSAASYYDKFFLYLRAGESVFIDMTSTAFAKKVELLDPDGNVVTTSVGATQITYVPGRTGYYIIHAGSVTANQTGRYDLQIR